MICEGIFVHTSYICRYGKRSKKVSAGLVRILHRTASPYCELMQSFGREMQPLFIYWPMIRCYTPCSASWSPSCVWTELSKPPVKFCFSPLPSFLLPYHVPAPHGASCGYQDTLLVKKHPGETTISATLGPDEFTTLTRGHYKNLRNSSGVILQGCSNRPYKLIPTGNAWSRNLQWKVCLKFATPLKHLFPCFIRSVSER